MVIGKPLHVRVCRDVRQASALFLAAVNAARLAGTLVRSSHARFRVEYSDRLVEWHPVSTVALHARGLAIESWDVVGGAELSEEAVRTLKVAELMGNADRVG